MSHLTRDELVEIGVSIPTEPLTEWATKQLANARTREVRLQRRGVHAPFLNELKGLIESTERFQSTLGREKDQTPLPVANARRIVEEAVAYWQEAGQIAKIEFGTTPYLLAKFRTGVRTGPLVSNLIEELESTVTHLREHSTQLGWLGVTEAFLRRGELLVRKLWEVQADLQETINTMTPLAAEWCHQKGRLYDLTRKLVRIGRLEFLHEPEQATAFNYDLVRQDNAATTATRSTKSEKTTAR